MTLKDWMVRALEPNGTSRAARWYEILHGIALGAGIAAMVFGTVPATAASKGTLLAVLTYLALAFFAFEYWARLLLVPGADFAADHSTPGRERLRWLISSGGIVDLLAWLPLLLALLLMGESPEARLFGVFWLLKLGRHAPRLGLLGRVLRHAREPLLAVFYAFLGVLLFAATLAYLAESTRQPDTFGTIPQALWWAITTLTTTGYGDSVPVTPLGRLVAGTVMVSGIFVFALWAGILATEFAQEMRRLDFLKTWDLVAKVPCFQKIGAASIADVVRLLRPHVVPAGGVVTRRGDPGDCMFFIVDGEIEIQVKPEPVVLGPGSFFGEIAIITGGPRTATAVAKSQSTMLMLDIVHFRELAAVRPELAAAIDEEARRRVQKTKTASSAG